MPDELYVRARRALLDAVEALAPHPDAVVLVGAQAIYLHTGDSDLAVAEYTTDADLTFSPRELADKPLITSLLEGAGFVAGANLGRWSVATAFSWISWPRRLSPDREAAAPVSVRTGAALLAAQKDSKALLSTATFT